MSYLGKVELKASNVKRWTGTPGAVSTILHTTLGFTPLNEQSTIITVNGVKQHNSAYTLSSTAINFTASLAATDEVEVIGILEVGTAMVPGDDVVDETHLKTTGTPDGTKFLRDDFNWSTVDALPTQTSHAGKFLTTNGSAASWATVDAGRTKQEFTATASQTVFTFSGGTTYSSLGELDVYLNGVMMASGDYSATANTSSVTLASGATASDIITLISWG